MVKNILFVLLGLFVLLFLMGVIFINKVSQSPELAEMKPPPALLEEPLPNPLEGVRVVRLSDGDTVAINSRDGLAFFNFWATWCRPCITEMPTIEKLYQAQKDRMDFFIIATEGNRNQIRAFLDRRGFDFPAYSLVKSPRTDSLTRTIPVSFLSYDSELRIYHKGSANWNSPSVHQLVEELAGGRE